MKPQRLTLRLLVLTSVITLSIALRAADDPIQEQSKIDSLEEVLNNTTDDSIAYFLLFDVYSIYRDFDRSQTTEVLKRILTVSKRLDDVKKIGDTYHKIGGEFLFKGQNDSARIYEVMAYDVIKNDSAQLFMTDILNNLALIYQRDNEYEKAIETYQQTIMIADTIGKEVVAAYAKANLMTLFMELNDEERALEYVDDIMSIDIENPSFSDLEREEIRSLYTAIYLNAGICYNDINQLDSAEVYFTKAQASLEYQSSDFAKNYYGAYIGTNLGDVYLAQAEQNMVATNSRALCNKALSTFKESNALFTKVQDQRGVTISLVNQGKALHELGRYQEAKTMLSRGLSLAKELNYKENMRDSYEYLSKNEEALGRYKNANGYLRKYMLYRDSIRNEERDKITEGLEVRFQTAKKENEIKRLELESVIASQEQARQRTIYLLSILGLIGLAYVIYSRMRYKKQQELNKYQQTMNAAMAKFVPTGFLKALGKTEITEVKLGDRIESEVTVVFTDIRSFTILSEGMTPSENFDFVKEYAERMGPIIERHGGFISQYLGDGLMIIFRHNAESALQACIEMQYDIEEYNAILEDRGRKAIKVGMGVHTGPLIMGIIGDEHRYDATLISDTVNTAAGLEMTTKKFGAAILVSGDTAEDISEVEKYKLQPRGELAIKGKSKAIDIYECDPYECRSSNN